jgi:hypothetical protein
VIRFLQAEDLRPCEIHQRLVAVCGENVTNADFHLFLKMKEHLACKRHADDEDLAFLFYFLETFSHSLGVTALLLLDMAALILVI